MKFRVFVSWPLLAMLIILALNAGRAYSVLAAPPGGMNTALSSSTSGSGGGSADYLLKTAGSGVNGAPAQAVSVGAGWTTFPDIAGGVTLQTPAVTTYGGQFQLVVLGTDNQIYRKTYSPACNCWSNWQLLPLWTPGFTSAPALAVWGNQLHVFVRGADHHIDHAWYDPSAGGWSNWVDVSHAPSASAPTATAYTGNGDRNSLHVLYLSDDASRNVMHLIYNNPGNPNQWIGPLVQLGGSWASAPAATQYLNQFQLWVVGSDNRLYQEVYDPARGWIGPWTMTNDSVGSAPAVTSYSTGQFQVFYTLGGVVAGTPTRQLFYNPADGGWTGPTTIGSFSSAPAATEFSSQLQMWSRAAGSVSTPSPTPTSTPVASGCPGSQTACIQAMLNLLNNDRAGAGVAPLTLNSTETNGTSSCVGSYGHSVHMASLGAISHDQFPADICIAYSNAGENVGQASYGNELTDLQHLDQSMMAEPHDPSTCASSGNHACNIISAVFHQVGIGIYYANNQTWLTEDFTN